MPLLRSFPRRPVICVGLCVVLCNSVARAAPQETPPSEPSELLRASRTMFIQGNNWFPPEPLEKKLLENREFQKYGFVIITEPGDADLLIVLDRKELTFDFTYRLIHQRTGVVLGAGKLIAWDGVRAAPGIAKQIVQRIKSLYPLSTTTKDKKPEKKP